MAKTPHLWVVDHLQQNLNQDWIDPELFFAAFFSEVNPLVYNVAAPGAYDARMKVFHRNQIVGARQLSTSTVKRYAQDLLDTDESFFLDTATQIALLEGEPEDIAALCLLMKMPDAKFKMGTILRDSSNVDLNLKPHLNAEEKLEFCTDAELRLCPFTEYIRGLYMLLIPYFAKGELNQEIKANEAVVANAPSKIRKRLFEDFFAFKDLSPLTMLGIWSNIGNEDGHVLQAPQFYYGGNA